MTERFVLHAGREAIENAFDVTSEREDYFEANYNISAGSRVPVIYDENGKRQIQDFIWGMIPEGANREKEGREFINIPSGQLLEGEGLDDSLSEALKSRRCIVPANGFYKWKFSKKKQTPFYIRLLSNEVMGLAGLYSVWKSESGRDVYSFALINTKANSLIQPVDDRMPVVLDPSKYGLWLSGEALDDEVLNELFQPYPLTEMGVNRVSTEVSDITSTGPELIQPIPK